MRLATDHSGARQHRHNGACFWIAPLVQGQSRECVFYSTLLAGYTTSRQQGLEVLGRGGGGSTATLQYSLQAGAAHAVATGAPEAVVHQQHSLNKGAGYCPKWCGRLVTEPPRQPLRLAVRGGREGCTTGYHKARLAGIQLYLQHAPPPLTHAGAPHACRHTDDTVQTPG